MIRALLSVFAILIVVSACASGKAVKTSLQYAPAEFQITDISVDIPAETANRDNVRSMLKNAATNLALAYNDTVSETSPEYVMEVSVQSYKPSPVAEALLRYRVILRNPDDGTEYRTLPVAYGNTENPGSQKAIDRKLIGGSMPEAFHRLYGMKKTPQAVQQSLAGKDILDDPRGTQRVSPAAYSQQPSAPATVTEGGQSDGPKVITCAIC